MSAAQQLCVYCQGGVDRNLGIYVINFQQQTKFTWFEFN